MGNTSFIIHDWFITLLKLKGKELLVFALIFSFTKDGRTKYYGSIQWIQQVLGLSRRSVIYALEKLEKNGFISKEIQPTQNDCNKYYANLEVVQKMHYQQLGSAKNAPQVVQNLHRGSAKNAPNNNIYNNTNINTPNANQLDLEVEAKKIEQQSKKFSFLTALKNLGVYEYNAKEFINFRKRNKSANTERAFNMLLNEINKAKQYGVTADDCICISLGYKYRNGKVWSGFKSEWLDNIPELKNNKQKGSTKSKAINYYEDY